MATVKTNPQIVLRPQDLVILLRLALADGPAPSYAILADELCLTASGIHAGVKRAEVAQLLYKDEAGKAIVIKEALRLFAQHGARYAFPATRGGESRGMPTSYAAAPLVDKIVAGNSPLPVWPYKGGSARGIVFYPLYPSVPQAAMRNPALYELLALFDAVRGGSLRERALAVAILEERLKE